MSAAQPKAPPPARPPSDAGRAAAFEDLTARARIRDAALWHFAEHGYERATIRAIAAAAGVSPGLVRHHFGSKQALHDACDEHVLVSLRRINSEMLEDPSATSGGRLTIKPFQRYVARALAEGFSTVSPIFDEMAALTEQWLARADERRSDPPAVPRAVRAAVLTAMAAGIPLLHTQLSRSLGLDVLAPEGDRLLALALLDIYSHAIIDVDFAAAAEVGYASS
jgi:AcrR family transcriptional regulator